MKSLDVLAEKTIEEYNGFESGFLFGWGFKIKDGYLMQTVNDSIRSRAPDVELKEVKLTTEMILKLDLLNLKNNANIDTIFDICKL